MLLLADGLRKSREHASNLFTNGREHEHEYEHKHI